MGALHHLMASCICVFQTSLLSLTKGSGPDMGETAEFLTITQLDAGTTLPADAFDQLRDGRVDAFVVRGVFAPDLCVEMAAALESNATGFEVTDFPGPFQSFFYGRNLNLNAPELDGYFSAAARFQTDLARFGVSLGVDIKGHIASVMSALDHGRPFEAAPGPGTSPHFFTTFRGHRPGGYIPAHFDNEQGFRPSYRHVAAATEGEIISFVVTLAEAEAGGMLELYDLLSGDPAEGHRNDDGSACKPDLATLRSQTIRVSAGSMVLARSGRRLHRVQPVEGTRTRWTLCSFMAVSRSGDRTYCWG